MTNSSKLAKDTIIYAIGDILPRAFSFISFPILTTYFTPSDYGITSYVGSITNLVFIFFNLSLVTYFFAHYYKFKSVEDGMKLAGSMTIFAILYSISLTIILFLIGPFFFDSWNSKVEFYPFISIGILSVLFDVLTIYPAAILRVKQTPLPLVIINILRSITQILGIIFVVKVLKGTIKDILLVQLFTSIIFGCIFLIITRQHIRWVFDSKIIKSALKFSLPLFPASLSYYFYTISDRILIEKYLSLHELGLYSTASTLALLLNIVTNSSYKAFEPYFFKIYGSENFNFVFIQTRNMLLFIVLIAASVLSLFSREFFKIFSGIQFQSAYLYVPIIIIGPLASSISLMYATVIISKGKTKVDALITIICGIISIILNVIFMRHFGIWSASFVFAFSFILALVLRAYYSEIKISNIYAITSAIITLFVVIIATYLINTNSFLLNVFIKFIIIGLIMLFLSQMLKIKLSNLIFYFK